MKKVVKLTFAVVLMAAAMPVMAQKLGYVDTRTLVMAMPEVKEVEANLKKMSEEFMLQIEEMTVESNKKQDEYQKTEATMSDAIKRLKQEEIINARQRIQELYESSEQELSNKEDELMKPLIEKARVAIETVMKAQGLAGVFEGQALVCTDAAQMLDVTPLAKKQLGIAE